MTSPFILTLSNDAINECQQLPGLPLMDIPANPNAVTFYHIPDVVTNEDNITVTSYPIPDVVTIDENVVIDDGWTNVFNNQFNLKLEGSDGEL